MEESTATVKADPGSEDHVSVAVPTPEATARGAEEASGNAPTTEPVEGAGTSDEAAAATAAAAAAAAATEDAGPATKTESPLPREETTHSNSAVEPLEAQTCRVPPPEKVIVQFRAAGGAPQLIKKKFKITAAEKFQTVIEYLRKQLKLVENDSLFLYINQAFMPAPDEIVGNLYQCFAVGGKLEMHYCQTPAWG